MKFQGNLIVELDSLTISDIRGNRRKCAECNQFFGPGDKVIILGESQYQENDTLPVLDEGLHFVHLEGKQGGSCLEDFISRLLNNKPAPESAGESKATEQVPSAQPT